MSGTMVTDDVAVFDADALTVGRVIGASPLFMARYNPLLAMGALSYPVGSNDPGFVLFPPRLDPAKPKPLAAAGLYDTFVRPADMQAMLTDFPWVVGPHGNINSQLSWQWDVAWEATVVGSAVVLTTDGIPIVPRKLPFALNKLVVHTVTSTYSGPQDQTLNPFPYTYTPTGDFTWLNNPLYPRAVAFTVSGFTVFDYQITGNPTWFTGELVTKRVSCLGLIKLP